MFIRLLRSWFDCHAEERLASHGQISVVDQKWKVIGIAAAGFFKQHDEPRTRVHWRPSSTVRTSKVQHGSKEEGGRGGGFAYGATGLQMPSHEGSSAVWRGALLRRMIGELLADATSV